MSPPPSPPCRTVMGRLFLCMVVGLAFIATAGTTALAVTASTANYPGALAFQALHGVIDAEHRESVKVGVRISRA